MVDCEGFGHQKCEILPLTFKVLFFSLKQRKLEVAMTITGENTSTNACSVLKMIIHKESHSWKMRFYTYFLQK